MKMHLRILDGKFSYKVANIAGPRVKVEIYKMFETNQKLELEVLSKSTVMKGWKPQQTQLIHKFKMNIKFNTFWLETGETFRIESKLRESETYVVKLKDRKHIPCYLAIIGGLDTASKIEIASYTTIDWAKIAREIPGNTNEIAESWDEND